MSTFEPRPGAPRETKPKTSAELEAEADAAYAACSRKVQRLHDETEQARDELQAAGRRREEVRREADANLPRVTVRKIRGEPCDMVLVRHTAASIWLRHAGARTEPVRFQRRKEAYGGTCVEWRCSEHVYRRDWIEDEDALKAIGEKETT